MDSLLNAQYFKWVFHEKLTETGPLQWRHKPASRAKHTHPQNNIKELFESIL